MVKLTADERADPSVCARIVDQIFHEANVGSHARRKCLRFLADSIAYAAAHWPDRWSVTLYSDYIRFNVGWVEAMVLGPKVLTVLVTGSDIPKGVRLGRPYARARGARGAAVPFHRANALVPRIQHTHREAMRAAATWRTGSGTRNAHSAGVITYLWRTLGLRTKAPGIESKLAGAPSLHIVQGGVENGDKRWLERATGRDLVAKNWVVPKSARVGDSVVIYIRGHGCFATGKISSPPTPRTDRPNRYGAAIDSVRLIEPAVSLEVLRRRMPEFQWATYPRSITTPSKSIAKKLLTIIEVRRKQKGADLEQEELKTASLEGLRAAALAKAVPAANAHQRKVIQRKRELAIKAYVLGRADGCCEYCREDAPFRTEKGQPYLECHHILRLADCGPDSPYNVIGVCPNCHRRAHLAYDRRKIKDQMKNRVSDIEARRPSGRN